MPVVQMQHVYLPNQPLLQRTETGDTEQSELAGVGSKRLIAVIVAIDFANTARSKQGMVQNQITHPWILTFKQLIQLDSFVMAAKARGKHAGERGTGQLLECTISGHDNSDLFATFCQRSWNIPDDVADAADLAARDDIVFCRQHADVCRGGRHDFSDWFKDRKAPRTDAFQRRTACCSCKSNPHPV